MPLLNIIGVDSFNHNFYAAFAFINHEKQEDYNWAVSCFVSLLARPPEVIVTDRELALMNALRDQLPSTKNLICVWHIHKNVAKNCKKGFEERDWERFILHWQAVVGAKSRERFISEWDGMKQKYESLHSIAIAYLEKTWLKDHSERFLYYHTGYMRTFGNTSTSRCEGSHAVLKSYIQVFPSLFRFLPRIFLRFTNESLLP